MPRQGLGTLGRYKGSRCQSEERNKQQEDTADRKGKFAAKTIC